MTEYYGVRKVVENGRAIGFAPEDQPFNAATITGEAVLVGVMSNGLWAIAADLTPEHDYQNFYDLYSRGIWTRIDLYEVPKNKIGDCPDEGEVSVVELERLLEAIHSE